LNNPSRNAIGDAAVEGRRTDYKYMGGRVKSLGIARSGPPQARFAHFHKMNF
jgi:hypothetical protein